MIHRLASDLEASDVIAFEFGPEDARERDFVVI